jgi:hypothetical protein
MVSGRVETSPPPPDRRVAAVSNAPAKGMSSMRVRPGLSGRVRLAPR